jgi:hypothetical protein
MEVSIPAFDCCIFHPGLLRKKSEKENEQKVAHLLSVFVLNTNHLLWMDVEWP